MTTGSGSVKGDVLLLVGTRKGGFILSSDKSLRTWALAGPDGAGSEVFHFVYDPRNGGRVVAAVNQMIWGRRSNSATTLVAPGLPGKGSLGFPAIRARLSTGFGTSNQARRANQE